MPEGHTKLGKRDIQGRIRIVKGILPNGKQARIQIATRDVSDAEAERRLTTIQALYDNQCRWLQTVTRDQGAEPNDICWTVWCLSVAKRLGAGQPITDSFLMSLFNEATMASTVPLLKQWGIPVHIEQEQRINNGLAIHRDQIETMIAELVQSKMDQLTTQRGPVVDAIRLPDAMAMTETATLHDALDAFKTHLINTSKKTNEGIVTTKTQKNLEQVERLKARHADMPLWKLNPDIWEHMITTWRNRPTTHKGQRCKPSYALENIKLLYRFGRWLHNSDYKWSKPDNFNDIDRKPFPLKEDDPSEAFQTITKQTYTPNQLALILSDRLLKNHHKTLIALSVNCAFGQSEIGQVPAKRFELNQPHPHSKVIGFETFDSDSWLTGKRPKTNIYGEHLLWPEVAEAIEPLLDGRITLWLTRTGEPIYSTNSLQPSSQIDNWWSALIKRVQKQHAELPSLPFGSLRDVLPNILTKDYGESVATLALQHKAFPSDDLLKCYANLPFGKLFIATRELHEYFTPMLTAL